MFTALQELNALGAKAQFTTTISTHLLSKAHFPLSVASFNRHSHSKRSKDKSQKIQNKLLDLLCTCLTNSPNLIRAKVLHASRIKDIQTQILRTSHSSCYQIFPALQSHSISITMTRPILLFWLQTGNDLISWYWHPEVLKNLAVQTLGEHKYWNRGLK